MGEAYIRNDDGSLEPIQPLGWQGHGIDWEVYRPGEKAPDGTTDRWHAYGYDEDVCVAAVNAKGPRRLNRQMRKAEKAHDLPRNEVLG